MHAMLMIMLQDVNACLTPRGVTRVYRATLAASVACYVPAARAATLDRCVCCNVTPSSVARSVAVPRAATLDKRWRQRLSSSCSSVCRSNKDQNDFLFKRFVHGVDSNLLNYKKYILANTLVQFGHVDHQTPKSKVNGPRVHFSYTKSYPVW
jgi:hypothetical protein